jgi:ABC-type Mn2+/Zn2+ transport system ATPase subunit
MLVELRNCVFGYRERPVVQVESLELRAGQALGVFGPNGAGKTTLVRGIAGLLKPLRGQVRRNGNPRFGYLPQQRLMGHQWPMTGLDAAALALSAHCPLGWVGRRRHLLQPSLAALQVDGLVERPFASLSGGQQQRILLAGALAAEPDILILDEALEGLDVRSRRVFIQVLGQAVDRGLCTVSISHNAEDLTAMSREIAWVHLAEEPEQPNRVEIIEPAMLAGRILEARHTPCSG